MPTTKQFTQDQIMAALQTVTDPEIPVISVVDLGIIHEVKINGSGKVRVSMIPTFAGCPALDVMKNDIGNALEEIGVEEYEVTVKYNEAWSSNRITDKGRKLLKDFGLSPPPEFEGMVTLDVLQNAICPRCSSNNTFMMNAFGPTACRAVHHCYNCKETFEQFKPL